MIEQLHDDINKVSP